MHILLFLSMASSICACCSPCCSLDQSLSPRASLPVLDGVAPVCKWCVAHAGEVPTAITCPWTKFGDVGETGGVSLRSLHFGRCCGCLPLRWRATFDNSVCQPILAVSFLIHFLAARPAVFHCCCLFCLLLPFFACCCLFCHALCFCLASLFLYSVMWFEQLK